MSVALYLAAFLLAVTGVAHSVLGERYILIRLFRREDLPKLFGGTRFTTQTLRFAWHLTTIAWLGFAAILVHLAQGSVSLKRIAMVVGITFCSTGFVTLGASRGRHLAWPVFLLVGCIALFAAVN
jgi:hypothetical protein